MAKLWRCEICGDPYIGDEAPANCPFCGVKRKFIREANEAMVNFDVDLNAIDKSNVEYALKIEISNAAFYFCAVAKTDDSEGKLLFKALAKVETEHAAIWKKILKLKEISKGEDTCHQKNRENLTGSHARETKAIEFYRKAAAESKNDRVKQIFEALVEVETDHLHLSEERL